MKIKVNDWVEVCNAYAACEELNGMTGQVAAISMLGNFFVKLDNGMHLWFLPNELKLVAKADVTKNISRKASLADVLKSSCEQLSKT